MSMTRIFAAVGIMALVTYLPRMIPLVFLKKKNENRFVQSFLHYVPYAVLAAMTFPDILYATDSTVSAVAGLGMALLLAYWNKGLLTVALGASAAVFLAEQLLRFL